jgi:hypothetical protein
MQNGTLAMGLKEKELMQLPHIQIKVLTQLH